MPKWGLTERQRETKPWGLDSDYLMPAKVITDPIHGDVFVMELERVFMDTEPFQRLRRIKQLGNTHLVYPGATHSRFSHSLGAVRVAQDLMDAVLDQRNNPKHEPDLFAEWEKERDDVRNTFFEELRSQLQKNKEGKAAEVEFQEDDVRAIRDAEEEVRRKIAEATIAARLGALLHDLCHVPFGHSLEDELGILDPHDENPARFDRIWARLLLPDKLDHQLRTGGLYDELRRLILSDVEGLPALKYPFVEDIVGNTICADLLDYLERDHQAAGLPIALGRRFVSAFYVMPSGDPDLGQHMILKITRPDGRERTDVVTEVLKYLRYRYELSERALVHHAKLAADAMIGKALEMWYDVIWLEHARRYLQQRHEEAGRKSRYRAQDWLRGADISEVRDRFESTTDQKTREGVDAQARADLDDRLSRFGDDALLEHAAELGDPTGHRRRAEGVRHLARDLLDRRLFKPVGTQHRPPRSPDWMFKKWGSADARRAVEEDAARWAGLSHRWQVLVWVPPEKMRLKIADVRVDGGDAGIMTFYEYERRGRGRGTDIYEAHRALWSIGVYLAPEYADDELIRRKVVARIAQQMNITFTQYESELGKQAYVWPDRLAASQLVRERLGADQVRRRPDLVMSLMDKVTTEQVQARGPSSDDSWDALYSRYQGAAGAIDELSAS